MHLRFSAADGMTSYLGSRPGVDTDRWYSGEVRAVPQATADYLLATFPAQFSLEAPVTPHLVAALDEPPTHRAMTRGGVTRRSA